jgi:hypothetical protein
MLYEPDYVVPTPLQHLRLENCAATLPNNKGIKKLYDPDYVKSSPLSAIL